MARTSLPTMADRLVQARRQSFVGRDAELALFDALVAPASDQAAVLFVHGPGGIGKSTLLRRFAARCVELDLHCEHIDARDIPPVVDALAFRMSRVLGDAAPADRRSVVLIDGYELLTGLDTALREQLAPQLPGDAVLVIAGHQGPSAGWRSDPGWAPLLHTRRLSSLDAVDCGAYLTGRGVPTDLHRRAIEFTHGHPLALALVGELVRQKGSLAPADSADIVHVLIDRLLQSVPSSGHRAALEAAAQVRVVDEPLLAALLDTTDAAEMFGWMRGLPFVDTGQSGLYLHDLAREVLASDLRWRHAERFAEFHLRARKHYLSRLEAADPITQASVLLDLIYLHPDLRQFLEAPADGALLRAESLLLSTQRTADVAAVVAMVDRHEGAESARIAGHWLDRQPAAWVLVRDPSGAVVGAVCLLALNAVDDRDTGADPALVAARRQLSTRAPLRPGETATLIRFWLSAEHYQSVSPVQSLIATQLARHYLTTPGLAVTVLPFAHPEEWEAFCAYADQRRAPAADFTVGGRDYAAFDHDWRLVPPAAWVAQMSLQEIGAPAVPTQATPVAAPLLVLTEEEFAAAVRSALRDFTRPDKLRRNALLRSRLITSRLTGTEPVSERVTLLQTLVKAAADTLATVPADRRLHRVLVRAYLSPAPTLERAAEVLELPSSTFRRLLGTAVGRVATVMWHQELDS